jgi:hypothetical protein
MRSCENENISRGLNRYLPPRGTLPCELKGQDRASEVIPRDDAVTLSSHGLRYCDLLRVVFEGEIEHRRPNLGHTERETQIQAFAGSHGWNAAILDLDSGRIRAIFQ